jgi:predicted DCC family thiol-disulfide oxidoreductase YuxK
MEIENLPKEKYIILFDGVCNLCDESVQYIIKKDKKDVFRFVSLQSELGIKILNYIGINSKEMKSIVLYKPGTAYYLKSEAVFKILKIIGRKYYFLSLFSFLPKSITNYAYDFVAKNRYKWYGKKDDCIIPTPALKIKFLE